MLKTFDEFLAQNEGPFVAGGDQVTLADISISLSLSMLDLLPKLDLSVYPSLTAWNKKVEAELKKVNKDGKFDQARSNMKAYAQMLKEKVLSAAQN